MEIPFKNKVYKMIPERSENGRKSMIKTKLWRIDHELIPGQFIDVVANVWVSYTENVSYIKSDTAVQTNQSEPMIHFMRHLKKKSQSCLRIGC